LLAADAPTSPGQPDGRPQPPPAQDAGPGNTPRDGAPPAEPGAELWRAETSFASLALALDPAGNIVVGGSGQSDFVLARFSPAGNMMTRKQFGGPGDQAINALKVAADGTLAVTGWFNGNADFGGQSRTAVGQDDLFVASYTADGTLRNVATFGGPEIDEGTGLLIDPSGDFIVVGYGGPLALGNQTVQDGFMFRVQPGGEVVWARVAGSAGPIQVSPSGPVIAGGGGVDLSLLSAHARASGMPVWMRSVGPQLQTYALGVDASGRVLATGSFSTTLTVAGQPVRSLGSADTFVMAVAADSGQVIWSQVVAGSQGQDSGLSVCGDRAGNVYVGASYEGSAAVAFGEPKGPPVALVAKFSASGTRQWVKVLPGGGSPDVLCDLPDGIVVGLGSALVKLAP
jgi:hypothetical protein